MTENHIWYKGPPPHIGWWWASIAGLQGNVVRYWNGIQWSFLAFPSDNSYRASVKAGRKSLHNVNEIFWRPLEAESEKYRKEREMPPYINLDNVEAKLTKGQLTDLIRAAIEKEHPDYKVVEVVYDVKTQEAGVAWNSYTETVFNGIVVKMQKR